MDVLVPGLSLTVKLQPFVDAVGAFGTDGLTPWDNEAR